MFSIFSVIIFRFLKKVLDLSRNQEYRYEPKLLSKGLWKVRCAISTASVAARRRRAP